MRNEDERRLRAEQRRQTWSGEVVRAGAPKPSLWTELTIEQRLTAMTRLCRSQWTASGRELIELPRDQWPGEVFEVKHGRDRAAS